jgi:hypothetical protein
LAAHALQSAPENPAAQTQIPLDCAVPWLLHVVASEYWHAAPTNPALHAQVPLA